MRYKVGDKVRIKSLDWYKEQNGLIPSWLCPCCGRVMTITVAYIQGYAVEEVQGVLFKDFMIEGLVEEEALKQYEVPTGSIKIWDLPNGHIFKDENGNVINATKIVLEKKTDKYMNENNTKVDMGEVSDGYHTFNELYEYRMLYNAALFNEFAKQELYDVHKSRKHSDGEYPFGDSNWFIVMAELPTGQISNHYEMKDWDKFQIPEKPLANKWDEHSPRDVAERLTSFTNPKKEYPKTFEECVHVLEWDSRMSLEQMNTFRRLIDARNAYWKIAGDEMGLGKPWEPDYDSGADKFGIICLDGVVQESNPTTNWERHLNKVLDFPTAEMRDAFKENFDPDIEICKELL